MTDLTNVWSEHLSRHQILTRADEKAATIDPSEDEEQYQMLLQKIGDAFHNEKDTHVTLDHDSRTDALELTTSTRLPRPLRPLEWTAYLEREPQSSLARYMLLPLIKAEADWESRQQNLMDQLKRKDWILGKLFDKLEAVGVDLSTIFPGVSGLRTGRKGATLSQAAKHIRGVAPFDEHGWLEEHKESTPDSNLAANLLAELFSKSEAVAQTNSFHLPPDSWWHGLSTASPTTLPRREDVGRTEEPKASRDDEMTDTASDTDAEDDDFEVSKPCHIQFNIVVKLGCFLATRDASKIKTLQRHRGQPSRHQNVTNTAARTFKNISKSSSTQISSRNINRS